MEEVKFYVRCYDKIELAPLMEELMAGDFHPKMKMFSAREVRLIVRYLGEPDGYVFMHEHADVK
mgnify:CR=1 FL=1